MKKIAYLFAAVLSSCSFFASATQTIAIVGAMDAEITNLLPHIKNKQTITIGQHRYYQGNIGSHSVIVTHSGVGKVNAAVTTTTLIREFKVDKLIFTGIAGAAAPQLSPTDVVISTALVQHDVDLTVFGQKPGHMDGFDDRYFYANSELTTQAFTAAQQVIGQQKVFKGIIATGDQFIANKQKVNFIHNEFNAMAIEMEGAAVAQVAFMFNKPFVVIRTISDKADGSAHFDYPKLKQITADNSVAITLAMLNAH
ncbi:5'-methylthioadenosine/adenosylhomocysteine nucleosidase [Photobacterium kishitanii]|uniref:adenosylhomocysteine nucleosidase n=1 Tax=Photobacterium kishitanii TaxID=318456 RepID=A0A2T3KF17_9GAMM|nr:5'-methylthioadenosine/adenosylhomocysteine nucleosidase [Photobacterium kishitanii]PSU96288.1 5'-methylthioadenosine/adenosylhomocysteine nucleosidase [Photobacterium kishitanii]